MSGGSSANNSWTILTPEETVAETLRPLAEGTEHHEESAPAAAGSGENQAAGGAESTEGLPVEGHLVSEGNPAELIGDTSTEVASSVPTSLDVSGSFVPGGDDALSRSEGLPEGSAQPSPEADSFTDSYTHITPSPDEAPASLLATETLGGEEVSQEEEELPQDEERLPKEGEQLPVNGAGLQLDEEESERSRMTPDIGKQADAPDSPDAEAGEEKAEKTGEEGEEGEEVRRRSLLAALERIGRAEEEEEEEAAEEEFQVPRRDEESGFSVNKCILGAVILLGLGTIFFSGVFMDLDEESDYATRELKDAELPGKQEWLNPEAPPPPVDADSTELLNKLASGSQQISVLQAQLQAQKEELKVAKGQAAEGAKERLRWEEMEKEYTASEASEAPQPPVKLETPPPGGQPEESRPSGTAPTESQPGKPGDDQRDKKKDTGVRKEWKEKSEWKEGEKRERKEGGKPEWKKEKFDKKDKEFKQKNDDSKHRKEKDWKSEKSSRGDEGKPWKDREGKKEWIEKSERKEWKEEKEWKKAKHEKVSEGKQWKSKDEKKSWKPGKDSKEKHVGGEEWKKGKDGHKESGKEKWEKKDWKEKGERKEWKSKDGKEGKWKGERKQWEGIKNNGKDGKWKDERKQRAESDGWKGKSNKDEGEWKRKQWKENEWKSKNGKGDDEWKRKEEKKQWERKEEHWKKEPRDGDRKDTSGPHKHRDAHKYSGGHHGDRKPAHTHRRASPQQPEYWAQQRERLQRNPRPTVLQCNSAESCAQAQGLLPVAQPEFSAFLHTYLAKAEEAGVDASAGDQLQKLAAEFFRDGVFAHDQMSFQDFVEDLSDVLEDMVEGDDGEEGEEDSPLEDEMDGFEREALKRFAAPGGTEKEKRSKGEWRKESVRGRG